MAVENNPTRSALSIFANAFSGVVNAIFCNSSFSFFSSSLRSGFVQPIIRAITATRTVKIMVEKLLLIYVIDNNGCKDTLFLPNIRTFISIFPLI